MEPDVSIATQNEQKDATDKKKSIFLENLVNKTLNIVLAEMPCLKPKR